MLGVSKVWVVAWLVICQLHACKDHVALHFLNSVVSHRAERCTLFERFFFLGGGGTIRSTTMIKVDLTEQDPSFTLIFIGSWNLDIFEL